MSEEAIRRQHPPVEAPGVAITDAEASEFEAVRQGIETEEYGPPTPEGYAPPIEMPEPVTEWPTYNWEDAFIPEVEEPPTEEPSDTRRVARDLGRLLAREKEPEPFIPIDETGAMSPYEERRMLRDEEELDTLLANEASPDLALRATAGNLKRSIGVTRGIEVEDEAELKAALTITRLVDFASKANTIDNLAHHFGVDPSVVARDLPKWEGAKLAGDIIEVALEADENGRLKNPITLEFIRNPTGMMFAKKDVRLLGDIENAKFNAWPSWWQEMGMSADRALTEDLPKSLANAWIALANSQRKDILGTPYTPAPETHYTPYEITTEKPREAGFLYDLFGMTGQVAGAATATATTGPAGGAAFMWAYIFGSSYGENVQNGVAHDSSVGPAMFNATAQALLEYIPISAIAKLYKTQGMPLKTAIKQVIFAGLESGATETIQQFPDWWSRDWATSKTISDDPEKQKEWLWNRFTDPSNWVDSLAQGGYEGIIATIWGTALGIPSIARSVEVESDRKAAKDARREAYTELANTVKQVEMRTAAPEKFEEHNKAVVESADLPPFRIALNEWQTYFDKRPKEEKKLAKDLGVEEQLEKARTDEGGDINIPVEKWNTYVVGTPEEAGLFEHVRLRADESSDFEDARQAAETDAKLKKDVDAATKAEAAMAKEAEPSGVKALREAIHASGFDLDAATFAADIARRLARGVYRGDSESEAAIWQKMAIDFRRFKSYEELAKHVASLGAAPLAPSVEGETVFGSMTVHPKGALMGLLEKGDLSTVLEELSHLFTLKLKERVEGGNAPESLRKAYDVLLNVAGGKLDRAGIEAIGAAQKDFYVLGKSPSLEAQRAFSYFRSWLSKIYAKAGKKANIDEETRRAFDILHATDQEIDDVLATDRIQAEMAAMLEDAKASDEAKEALRQRRAEAREAPKDKRFRRLLAAMRKARGGLAAIRERIANEVEQEPVYAAVKSIIDRGGVNRKDFTKIAGLSQHAEEIEKKFPGVANKRSKVPWAYALVGTKYDSEETLIDDLIKSLPLKDEIDKRVAEQLATDEAAAREQLKSGKFQEDEDFLTDERLHAAAAEHAVITEDAQKEGEKRAARLSVEAVKRQAEADLLKMEVRDALRTDRITQQARYYGKKAAGLFAKKKNDEAATAKRLELYYLALAQASVRFSRGYGSLLRFVDVAQKTKAVLFEWQEQIRALAQRFGFKSRGAKGPTPPLEDFLNAASGQLDGTHPPIADWVEKQTEGKAHTDLKVAQLVDVKAAFKILRTRGRDQALAIKESKGKRIADLAAELSEGAKTLPTLGVPDDRGRFNAFFHRWVGVLRAGGAELETPQIRFRAHDGFPDVKKGLGKNERLLWGAMTDAHSRQQSMIAAIYESRLKEINKLLYDARKRFNRKYGKAPETINGVRLYEHEKLRTRAYRHGMNRWDCERFLTVLFNLGNPGNEKAVMMGHGYTNEQLIAIKEAAHSLDYALVSKVGEVVESLYEVANETHKRVNGVPLEKVETAGYYTKTHDGKYVYVPGFYYPIVFDGRLSDFVAQKEGDDIVHETKQWIEAAQRYRNPRSQFAKIRQGGAYPPLLKIDVLFRHIFDVVHYATHTEVLNDIDKITRSEEWRDEFERVWGVQEYGMIRPLLQYAAIPDTKEVTSWGRWFEKQRSLAVAYLLWGNFRTLLIQPTAFANPLPEIPAKYWAGMFVRSLTTGAMPYSTLRRECLAKSSYLRECLTSLDRDIAAVMKSSVDPLARKLRILGKDFTVREVTEAGLRLIGYMDSIARIPAWYAAYRHATDNLRKEEAEAILYADTIISGSNPGPRPIDFSDAQRRKGAFRFLTTFMGPSIVFGSRARYYWSGVFAGRISLAQFATHVIGEEILAPMAVTSILHMLATGEMPEWKEYILGQFRWWLSFIPIASQLLDPREVNTVATIGMEKLRRAGVKIWNAFDDNEKDGEWLDVAYAVGDWYSFTKGIPALRVARTAYNGILEDAEGEPADNVGDYVRKIAAPVIPKNRMHKEHE